MDGPSPIRSAVEWVVAAALLIGLAWFTSDYALRWLVRRSDPAVEAVVGVPPGVPPGAISVPVLMLLDDREIRVGLTHEELERVLGSRLAVGESRTSNGAFGPRTTQQYDDRGTRFFVTTERTEEGGPVKVTGIYLP